MTRHYDQAFEQFRELLEKGSRRAEAHRGLADVYLQKGQFEVAIREYRKAIELCRTECPAEDASWFLSALGEGYALAGRRAEATQVLGQLNEMSKHQAVAALHRAAVYIGLGDKQQAFAWLEKAYERHQRDMLGLKVHPRYDPLRSDPRFQDILRRMNFPR